MADYYTTLGVAAEATDDEIRRAYRRLALRWHPDRNAGDPASGERFKEISEAYAVLIDPIKRRDYDRLRRYGAPGEFHARREDIFRDLFADPRASAIFEELSRELQRMGLRVDRRDFHETLFGGRTVVRGTVIVVSPFSVIPTVFRLVRAALRGASRGAPAPVPPPTMFGRLAARAGRWLLGLPAREQSDQPEQLAATDLVVPLRLARTEATTGARKRVTLVRDDGTEDVLVTVPPGIQHGTRLRLRGKGRISAGGRRGDAYLTVEIADV